MNTLLRRVVRRIAWIEGVPTVAALLVGAVTSSGCTVSESLEPKLYDEVWCDIKAAPCLLSGDDDFGIPTSCLVTDDTSVPASAPGGDRVCFNGVVTSPEAACASLCARSSGSALAYPLNPMGCSASVNADTTVHPNVNAQGYQSNGCISPDDGIEAAPLLSAAGTDTVDVNGSVTVTYGGASQTVAIKSGRFSVTAPRVSCAGDQSACGTQINHIDLSLEDLTFPGMFMENFTVSSGDRILTPSGQFVPPEPPAAPDATFLFSVPAFSFFDAIGTMNGKAQGFYVTTPTQVDAVMALGDGSVVFEVLLEGSLGDVPVTVQGYATTKAIVERAPIVDAPATREVDITKGCSANVTLAATASSSVDLPVTLTYVVDNLLVGRGPSLSTTMAVGSHAVTVVGIDALGGQGTATEMVTVTGVGCH